MSNEIFDYAAVALGIAILGFLWNLHQDVADLRERMARREELFEGFTKAAPKTSRCRKIIP